MTGQERISRSYGRDYEILCRTNDIKRLDELKSRWITWLHYQPAMEQERCIAWQYDEFCWQLDCTNSSGEMDTIIGTPVEDIP